MNVSLLVFFEKCSQVDKFGSHRSVICCSHRMVANCHSTTHPTSTRYHSNSIAPTKFLSSTLPALLFTGGSWLWRRCFFRESVPLLQLVKACRAAFTTASLLHTQLRTVSTVVPELRDSPEIGFVGFREMHRRRCQVLPALQSCSHRTNGLATALHRVSSAWR